VFENLAFLLITIEFNSNVVSIYFSSVQNHKNCVKYLIHILKFNHVIKDALRELGFIEVLIARLHHFASLLKESIQDPNGTHRIALK
jgi:hypothetical protein